MDASIVQSPEAPSSPQQPPTRTSFSLLGDLPVELVYELIPHLTDESKLFLSLTNTAFRSYVGELPFVSQQRLEFLQILVRNYPALMVCHDCLQLHKRDQSLDRPFDSPDWVELKSFCLRQRFFYGYPVAMSYVQIQLVMDRHLLSPAHGVPLSALVLPPQFRFLRPGNRTQNHAKLENEPRIVNGELIIKGRFTEWREDGDMAAFGAAVGGWPSFCPHVACGNPPFREPDGLLPSSDCEGIEREMPDLASFDFANFASPGLVGTVRGCAFCCTDYQTVIHNCGNEGRGWRVEIFAWQCFGAGRDPFDDKWLALIDEWQIQKKNPGTRVEHVAGSVRDAFEGAQRQVPLEKLECEEPDWDAPEEEVWDVVETGVMVGNWHDSEESVEGDESDSDWETVDDEVSGEESETESTESAE
ncbi:hypothetical protein IWX49DRAFT_113553 [Phyllosticta citricarpa]|uniref:F-box domain-containing protein n=2 Tax=Phyllosticta TaxID=121621 RepID=A0ABR1MH32_9PEZI